MFHTDKELNDAINTLTPIPIEDLKVGDTVCHPFYPQYGWSSCYKYPIFYNFTIQRITPKRTKIITNHGEYTNKDEFYHPCDVTQFSTKIAKAFEYCKTNGDIVDLNLIRKLNPQELLDVQTHLQAIQNITAPYLQNKK